MRVKHVVKEGLVFVAIAGASLALTLGTKKALRTGTKAAHHACVEIDRKLAEHYCGQTIQESPAQIDQGR